MSLVLCRKLNHRNIELHDSTRGEAVGILKRSGEYGYVPWLGFIDRSKATQTGRPVKLLIARIGHLEGSSTRWRDLQPGEHVQGCLTREGAYAVTDLGIKVV